MRTAPVAQGEGARLAAAVSLVLASAKVRDHVADRDGLLGRKPVAVAARRIARSWDRAGARTGASLGFDTAVLVDAVDRQGGIEALAGLGTSLLTVTVTEPTETATAAAFAHTAVLAGKPHNMAPLAEAGRLFGRLAHLLDAVEGRETDAASGAWNPPPSSEGAGGTPSATGTDLVEARRLADDAVHGIRLALREVDFVDSKLAHVLLAHVLLAHVLLAHVLLAHELTQPANRSFRTTECGHAHDAAEPQASYGPYGQPPQRGGNPYGFPPEPPRPQPRGFFAGCAAFLGLCCTCKMCCADEYEGPWSRKKREGCCSDCDCDCSCCEVCQCCECLSCASC
jgi:hypothetical protein